MILTYIFFSPFFTQVSYESKVIVVNFSVTEKVASIYTVMDLFIVKKQNIEILSIGYAQRHPYVMVIID